MQLNRFQPPLSIATCRFSAIQDDSLKISKYPNGDLTITTAPQSYALHIQRKLEQKGIEFTTSDWEDGSGQHTTTAINVNNFKGDVEELKKEITRESNPYKKGK